MSFSFKRAVGALALLVIAFPGICNAAGSAPPPVSPPVDSHHNSSDSTSPSTVSALAGARTYTFLGKTKLACFDAPSVAPGAIIFETDGPGTLTLGMTIKVVIQPTGKIINYVLPYDLPPQNGVILYDAYPPGSTTQVVTCTVTATPHPGPRIGKPRS